MKRLPQKELNRLRATEASALLKALANEDRLTLLCQLCSGSRCVGELEESVGVHQPTLSQQLARLRSDGLVKTERRGKQIYYSIASPDAMRVIETLYEIYCKG